MRGTKLWKNTGLKPMTNNELSKKILSALNNSPTKKLKFIELVKSIGIDKKRLALNLFYLEANGFIELRSVYSSDALFPEIYLVSLKQKGAFFAENQQKLDILFPSDMDYSLVNLPSTLENLKNSLKMWADGHPDKMRLYNDINNLFSNPLFLDFIEEFYSGKRPK